ncbi:MAG: hypothetical protein KKB51_08150 [Candidatus Riflebacteria bacterium]|nr:hypothetical protein [Candidatus Riflebacteria bacterium]
MRSIRIWLVVLLCVCSVAAYAQIEVGYGEGPGKVGYFNQNNHPGEEEPYPVGPLAFRLDGDYVWVADSIGAKILKFDRSSKLFAEFSTVASPAECLIEDFALVKNEKAETESLWIIDGMNKKLIHFDVAGKKLGEIANDELVQPFRVEVGRTGHIFVADKGAQVIFLFDAAGKLVSKTNWEWSGFAVAGETDTLFRLFFEEESQKSVLVVQMLSGEIAGEIVLELPAHINPELWWADETAGECIITYTPATGFEGKLVVARVGFDGQVKATGELTPPYVMNRFIDRQYGNDVWLGIGNFDDPPQGSFKIEPIALP